MIQKLKLSILALLATGSLAGAMVPSLVAAAPIDEVRNGVTAVGGGNEPKSLELRIQDIINIILFILGAVAVIMIIIGGFRYVTSGGDSGAVSSAKNTILYAVIGLVVAILAYAIVNFVITSLAK